MVKFPNAIFIAQLLLYQIDYLTSPGLLCVIVTLSDRARGVIKYKSTDVTDSHIIIIVIILMMETEWLTISQDPLHGYTTLYRNKTADSSLRTYFRNRFP